MEGTPASAPVNARLNLLGESLEFRNLVAQIERFARCEATVLIDGETGTGKELAARAIHYLSARGKGPFIPINCGSLPDALLGSELFGHLRGAFTHAHEARQGLIAQAAGGTLFLDELEALSRHAQVTLLRFLQDHEYRPLGAGCSRVADVRVVGATNANLAELARTGEFRRDLLYRLSVLTLDVPPLRVRGDDIVVLAQAFVRKLCAQYQTRERRLHPEALAALRSYAWPGNVRELENTLHREFLLADGNELMLRSFQKRTDDGRVSTYGPGEEGLVTTARRASEPSGLSFREAKARAIAQFEREYVRELLTQSGGNVSEAARLAGKERSRFSRLLRKYQLCARDFRAATGIAAPR